MVTLFLPFLNFSPSSIYKITPITIVLISLPQYVLRFTSTMLVDTTANDNVI